MGFLKTLTASFRWNSNIEPPIPPQDLNFDLGVQAAEIEKRRNLGLPEEIYSHRLATAQTLLADLMTNDSFDYARFNEGFVSQMDAPYEQSRDVLSLKKNSMLAMTIAGVDERVPSVS